MAKIQIKSEKLTPFGGIFSGHGAIWLHIVICNRLYPRSMMWFVRLSAQRNHPFSHEYLLLWWLMYPRMSLFIWWTISHFIRHFALVALTLLHWASSTFTFEHKVKRRMMIDEGIGFAICHIRCLTSLPHRIIFPFVIQVSKDKGYYGNNCQNYFVTFEVHNI